MFVSTVISQQMNIGTFSFTMGCPIPSTNRVVINASIGIAA